MIFVSTKGMFESVRAEVPQYTPKGDPLPSLKRLYAKFERGGVPRWVFDKAQERLTYQGIPDGITREQRTFMFDTDVAQKQYAWTDDERALVESYLLERSGIDYILVEPERTDAPWPKYDDIVVAGRRTIDHVAAAIADTVRDLGLNPLDVIRYEEENLNRPEVVAALHVVASTPDVDVIQVVA